MVHYSDIHISDLKNLTFKSFTVVLLNDLYPLIYSDIDKLQGFIYQLKSDYDVEVLESLQKRIYAEFDEIFRKEKLVLFPFILKLEEENKKSDNCLPFSNIKTHVNSMTLHLNNASEIIANYYINNLNDETISSMNDTILELIMTMKELQTIKEKHFYARYKGCGACSTKHFE